MISHLLGGGFFLLFFSLSGKSKLKEQLFRWYKWKVLQGSSPGAMFFHVTQRWRESLRGGLGRDFGVQVINFSLIESFFSGANSY